MKIRNYDELLSTGDIESRKALLDVTNEVLENLDSLPRMKQLMTVRDGRLYIGSQSWDLQNRKHVYLLGAGKACNAMAQAVCEVVGDYLTEGIISVKILEPEDRFHNTQVFVGGHPQPNRESVNATNAMRRLIESSGSGDLFLCVVSGGSSALLGGPVDGITLEEEAAATDILLKSGASIREINAVRRHISRANGGRLAQMIDARGADMICFAIRDSLSAGPTGDISIPLAEYPATPFGHDDTTIQDACDTVARYGLRDRLPNSVVSYLDACGPEDETPKRFPRFVYYYINTVPDSCLLAEKAAQKRGLRALILTSFLEGEAREAGRLLASIAREIQRFGHPIKPPCLLISAGEVFTRIDPSLRVGLGGPSQEMTLSFAVFAANIPGAALLSIDSEGTDGPTPLAGGLTDSATAALAVREGIDLEAALYEHAAYDAVLPLHCGVRTGNTGTNLCDFNLLYVPEKKELKG